jgi:hypothetical protein
MTQKAKVAVMVGSLRAASFSLKVAKWIVRHRSSIVRACAGLACVFRSAPIPKLGDHATQLASSRTQHNRVSLIAPERSAQNPKRFELLLPKIRNLLKQSSQQQ